MDGSFGEDAGDAIITGVQGELANRGEDTVLSLRADVPEDMKLLSVLTDVFDCFFRFLAAGLATEGVLDEEGRILVRTRRDTPDRSNAPRVVEDTIVEVIEELLAQAEEAGVEAPATVGVGAAGFVAADSLALNREVFVERGSARPLSLAEVHAWVARAIAGQREMHAPLFEALGAAPVMEVAEAR